jgi:tetratricopeptide (TPR) repeat protein
MGLWSQSGAMALLGVLMGAVALLPSPLAGQGLVEGLRRGVRSQAAFVRGKAFYDAGDYERARERFLEAVSLDGNHDEARALLAWSQHFLGEYRAASINFKAAIRRQPGWDGLHDGLGWSRFHLKRHHLAAEAFRTALDLNPDHTDARIGLGSALFELSRYDEALVNLQRAAGQLEPLVGAKPPALANVHAKIAWSLYYLGRHQQALQFFERALRSRPDWSGLHNGIGWCNLKLGQKAEARFAFQRALELKPDYDDALEGLRQTRG